MFVYRIYVGVYNDYHLIDSRDDLLDWLKGWSVRVENVSINKKPNLPK